ncbi:MAG: serine/threonine-protein kinase [Myxococcota bacterium]
MTNETSESVGTPGTGEVQPRPQLGLRKVDKTKVFSALFDDDVAPPTLGRFRIVGRLGRGAMGTVLEAHDPQLDRPVALKVLRDARGGAHQKRLVREAHALARLSHPNVVQVFESGEADGRVFIAMELVRGRTLQQWHRQPHPWRECLAVYLQAGRGLAAAHAVAIVHRDFKPANCILDDEARVRVLDFGLARERSGEGLASDDGAPSLRSRLATVPDEPSADERHDGSSDGVLGQRITRTGTMMGTPAYMAPEQAGRMPVDARADQFSLCVALYEALYGERPFSGGRLFTGEARPPTFRATNTHASLPRIPAWLRGVLLRGLQPRPEDRFPSVEALVLTIEGHLRARRRWRVGLGIGAGLLLTVGTTLALAPSDDASVRCDIDAQALAGTWDDTTREEVRAAMQGSGIGAALAAHRTVDAAFEGWATDWVAARQEACVATHVDGTASGALLDRRIDCLDRQQKQAAALVGSFASASAATVAHGAEILADLPEPRRCHQPRSASERGALPTEPDARAAVLDGYARVAEIRVRLLEGSLERAAEEIEDVASAGRAHGFVPLQVEALVLRGDLAMHRARYDEAAEHLTDAVYRATAEGLTEEEVEARRRTVKALVGLWSKPETETMMLDEFVAAAARAEIWTPTEQRTALAARARLAGVAGEHARALALYAELLRIPPTRPSALELLLPLYEGTALAMLARYAEARSTLEDGLATAREAWGDGSTLAAKYEQDLGMLALETGSLDEAGQRLARARTHMEAAVGPDGAPVARIRFSQAKLAMASGAFDQARGDLEFVGTVFERELGPTHEETGQLYNALGVARFYEGDYPGSIEAYERALAVGLSVYGPAHAEVALLHSNIAESRAALGEHARALDEYVRALAIMGIALPEDHPMLATAHKGRGQSLLALGRPDEARPALERALELLLRPPSEPFELADARLALARTLGALGEEPTRVRELARLAAQGFETLGFDERAALAHRLLLSKTRNE